MKKLTPVQKTVLQSVANGKGRLRSFEGPQLRAAGALLNRELIVRKGPSLGYVLTNAGEDYAREAGWLKVAAPEAPAPEVTPTQVLGFQVQEQHRRTLRAAEELMNEITRVVERLRDGAVPATAVNPNTVAFLIADHAKLVTLRDVLESAQKDE